MPDDIAKYLRLSQTRFNRHAEAAEEIERLRKELEIANRPHDIWHNCSHCQGHEPGSLY
jgi:hypothetical protein